MAMVAENWPDLLEKGMNTIYHKIVDEAKPSREELFTIKTPTGSQERDSSVSAIGDHKVFAGTVTYEDPTQGYDVTYTFEQYTRGIIVTRKMMEDELYNTVQRLPDMLGVSADRTMEKLSLKPWSEAFTTTGAHIVGDSLSLCNSAHTSTKTTTTQSNSGTTTFAPAALEATRILGVKMKGFADEQLDINYDTIVAPIDLQGPIEIAIGSKGEPDVTTNNININQGRYRLIVLKRLTDASDWFMVDYQLMKKYLFWWDKVKPMLLKDKDTDTLQAKFCSYFRVGWGTPFWYYIYGHSV